MGIRRHSTEVLLEQAKSLQASLGVQVTSARYQFWKEKASERVCKDYDEGRKTVSGRKTHTSSLRYYNQIQAAWQGANTIVSNMEAALTTGKEAK